MKSLKSLSILAMTFVLFLTSFSSIANAMEANDEQVNDEQVAELAEKLEFIFEKATIKDKQGNVIDLDVDMIEEKFGVSPETEQLREQIIAFKTPTTDSISTFSASVDRCVENKIITGYGDLISGAIIGAIIDDIASENYLSAAKRLLKMGVRGTPIGIAGSLAGMLLTCTITHGNNPWN